MRIAGASLGNQNWRKRAANLPAPDENQVGIDVHHWALNPE